MRELTRKRHEKKKDDMIPLFMKVFCERGLDGSFMRGLADCAGVSEGLLYRYFENKDDLIRQCTVYFHARIQKELTEIILEYIDRPALMPEQLLRYTDSVLDICRFLLQVMAHPVYHTAMDETNAQVQCSIMEVAAAFREILAMDKTAATGAALLLNGIINDYILKKSRESFLIQFEAIALLLWGPRED